MNQPIDRSRDLFFDPLQKKRGANKRDEHAGAENDKIDIIKGDAGAVQVHEPKSAAEMGERENFRDVTDESRQLFDRSERAGKDKDRQKEKDGELNSLRLRARYG